MIPGTFVYTYFATSLISGAVEGKREAYVHLIVSTCLFVLLSVAPLIYKRLKTKSGSALKT